ncbi:MAG: amidohydrolase family protein, partial [Pseudomonadota bacterium]
AGQVGDFQVGGRAHPATQILSLALNSDSEPKQLTSGYNGAFRPMPSPDGTKLAFGRREGALTSLWVLNLATGKETRLLDWVSSFLGDTEQRVFSGITRDALGSRMFNDLLPGYEWTSDSKEILITKDRRIVAMNVDSGKARRIPFAADVELVLSQRVEPTGAVAAGPVRARALRWFSPSPDGSRLAFQALGRIWIASLIDGAAELLSEHPVSPTSFDSDALFEFAPAWSPSGDAIAYTTWHKTAGGHLWIRRFDENAPRRVTSEPAVYSNPSFAPGGKRLVYGVVPPPGDVPGEVKRNTKVQLRTVSAYGGQQQTLWRGRGTIPAPQFSSNGKRIYFLAETDKGSHGATISNRRLVSINPAGGDEQVHLDIDWLNRAAVSPGGDRVALAVHDSVYIVDLRDGKSQSINLSGARKVADTGAESIAWINDTTVSWGFATQFFTVDLEGNDTAPAVTNLEVLAPRDAPKGQFAITGARLITMSDTEGGVIERGDIIVSNNRIEAIGPSGVLEISEDAFRVDGRGLTIIPGFIDIHAHPLHGATGEITAQQTRGMLANLAYGITTGQDPASDSVPAFAIAELIETGQTLGPRYFGAGSKVGGFQVQENELVESLDTAHKVVERRRKTGSNVIKEYGQPSRLQRQWVTEAARAAGLGLVHEGTGDLHAMLTSAVDGATIHEHSMSYAPVGQDVITLLAFSKMVYDSVLLGARTGSGAAFYLGERLEEMLDVKLARFVRPGLMTTIGRMFKLIEIPEYDFDDGFINQGADAARLARAGGALTVGSHGDGFRFHLEMWSYVIAGMSPLEALSAATVSGAKAIGIEQELGTLAAGKLADFVMLTANPLDDIENTRHIRNVVKNGRIYSGDNLDQVWPQPRERPGSHWLK